MNDDAHISHLHDKIESLEYQVETLLELRKAAIAFVNDQTYGNKAALAEEIKKTAPEPRE